jgi:hypothetical protein
VRVALLEPFVIPGLDKALLELLLVFGVIIVTGLVLTLGSIAGLVRAVRRRRRGGKSSAAIGLAVMATTIASLWLCYWFAADVYERSNPINALFAVNAALCVLPLIWLIAAIRVNHVRHGSLGSR